MRLNKLFLNILCGIFLVIGNNAYSQVSVVSSDSINCGTTCTKLTAFVTGDVPTNAGITVDDVYSVVHNIGFTFNFYGVNYTQLVIAANGGIDFNIADAGMTDPWPITAVLLGNPSRLNQICGPWCDIDISAGSASGTITYSTDGVAPYRKYVLTYCAPNMYSCTAQRTTSQIIIYETTNIIEVHVARKPVCAGWNSGRAIIGVQNAAGTAATVAPGRDFPASYVLLNESWRFTPVGGGTSYSVASIPYATVPLASSAVYWYNATTGAFLGTGTSIVVCPTTTTTYKAGARGCADTSFGYYTVIPSGSGPVVTLTTTNPTQCGVCDGTITLHGLGAGLSDTVTYTKGGVPQPPVVATVAAGGTITLTNLCPGTYGNFVVKQMSCASLPVGPVTLTDPAITATVTPTNPSRCGECDGSLLLSGLYPSHVYNVSYTVGSIPQPTIATSSDAAGTIKISGLCAGTYSNIITSFGACTATAAGPYTLINPPISISSVDTTSPTLCGECDGRLVLNGLYPNHPFSVRYNFNGVLQPTISVTTSATGTITLTNLCAGTYDNIVAWYGDCATPPVGPYTLTNPPIAITSIDITDPSFCGVCDGKLVLNGLYPNHVFTVNYNFNGVPQPAISDTTSATGTLTITGLCAGSYTNIVASFGVCITPPAGPSVLVNPPTPPLSVKSYTNPTECGYCNGEIVIWSVKPYSSAVVSYTRDGVGQTPFTTTVYADSTVHLTGLCAGNHTGISVKIGDCIYDVAGSVNLQTIPIVDSFSYSIHQGCPDDTVYFTNWSTTAPGAGLYYVWTYGDGHSDTTTNPVHVFAQGTYTVTLTATNRVCLDSFQAVLNLVHPLQAAFIDTPSIICQGQTVDYVNTSVTSGSTPGYLWSFSDNGAQVTTTNASHTFNSVGVHTVTLVATDGIPCKDTAMHMVYVDTNSGVVMNVTDTVICLGTYMTFEGLYSPIGNTGVGWNFGDGDTVTNQNPISHAYHHPGTYTVTVSALYRACHDVTTTRNIIVFPHPPAYLGPDTAICPGSMALVLDGGNDTNDPSTTYKWNTGETTRTINVVAPGYYYVTVGSSGCRTSDTIWVKNDCYMSLPNVFTPNGDGVNDYFFPRQLLTSGLTSFHMNIYNRWGQLVFETSSLDGRGWDGKFNDIAQPQGVFVYVIDATFKDGQQEHHQGNVTLLR